LVTAVHVPAPLRLQAWQVPHAELAQHAPSTQLLLPHSLPTAHVAPFAFLATHAPAAQWLPEVQSPSPEQLVRHVVVPHTYGAQPWVVALEQLPLPEQNAGFVWVEPVHDPEAHWTEDGACWQAPAPSHAPVLPQGGLAVQRPCGSATPVPTAAQLPALPPTLQAWQVGQLGLEQQTPSTQLPVPHSLPLKQLAPGPFLGTQLPPMPVQ
jgi:hypothetical protein